MARKKRSTGQSDTVLLRLKQNHYVGGVFAPEGTEVPFSKAEADRRLKRTRLWEIV